MTLLGEKPQSLIVWSQIIECFQADHSASRVNSNSMLIQPLLEHNDSMFEVWGDRRRIPLHSSSG